MRDSLAVIRRNYRQLALPFWLLIILSLLSLVILVVFVTHNQNEKSVEATRHLADAVLAANRRSIETTALEYGFWDQAVDNLVTKPDSDWADSNVGIYLYENADVSASYVLTPENQLTYGFRDGERTGENPLTQFKGGLEILVSKAREGAREDDPVPQSGFVHVADVPHLVAAVELTTYFEENGTERNQATDSVLILIRNLDDKLLSSIARDYLLPGLEFTATQARDVNARLDLSTIDGSPLGSLVWNPDLPGNQVLPMLLGGIVALFVLMMATAFVFLRRIRSFTLELARARDSANDANIAKSEFLANMSHELRTPLNAILGFSQIISRETFGAVGDQKYVESGKDIHEAGTHLLELINDILDISKIEAGQMELKTEPVNFNEIVESTLRLVRNWATQKGIDLNIQLSGEPSMIEGDQRAVRQIILNLLTNAVKFTPTKGKIICTTDVQDTGKLVFSVEDTGIGIREEDLKKVMEPFGQAAPSDIRDHQGTGLGLPITSRLANMLGGHFSMESEPDVGTKVSVTFPLHS